MNGPRGINNLDIVERRMWKLVHERDLRPGQAQHWSTLNKHGREPGLNTPSQARWQLFQALAGPVVQESQSQAVRPRLFAEVNTLDLSNPRLITLITCHTLIRSLNLKLEHIRLPSPVTFCRLPAYRCYSPYIIPLYRPSTCYNLCDIIDTLVCGLTSYMCLHIHPSVHGGVDRQSISIVLLTPHPLVDNIYIRPGSCVSPHLLYR